MNTRAYLPRLLLGLTGAITWAFLNRHLIEGELSP